MSATVASASTSVPSSVISSTAKPGPSETADALFDALFAAVESLTGGGTDVSEASPAASNSSEPQSENSASAPSGPGAWMAQIDPADANAQNPRSDKKISPGEPRGNNLPVQSDRNTALVRTSHGVKPQAVTAQLLLDGKIALNPLANADQIGALHNKDSSSEPELRTNVKNPHASSDAQTVAEVLTDQLVESAPSEEPQLENTSDVADQSVGPRPAHPKANAQPRVELSDKQGQSDSEPGPDLISIAQIPQLESTVRPSALPSDTARFFCDHSQTLDEDGNLGAVDAASPDRNAQIPTRAESPKSALPHLNSSVRPDGNLAPTDVNGPPVTPQPTDANSVQKTVPSTRSTTAAPMADGSSVQLAKADDVNPPQGGVQPAPFHHADAGTFAPAGGAPPQITVANSDAPVRIAFTATPNSLGQPAFDALALRIATRSSEGERNFSIRLDPPELGRVEVSLSVNSTGHAQAEITADKPQTLDLLQRDAPVLERALKDAGLNLAGGFAFSLKGESRSGGNGRDLQHGARGRALHIAGADAPSAGASLSGIAMAAVRAYGIASSRLDIRV
jgi:flagellar hook-length control protein FliK